MMSSSVLMILILLAVLILGLAAVVIGSIRRKGNWGINPSAPICPECDTPQLAVRTPKSWNQALWGGWTCSGCECEMDKWGKARYRTIKP